MYTIKPRSIRIEASTFCQLKCPCCPNTIGIIEAPRKQSISYPLHAENDYLNPWTAHSALVKDKPIGKGYLEFTYFRNLINKNPWIRHAELSNWGEMFLNPELLSILEYANKNKVLLTAENGVNLNTAEEAVLEALVRFKFLSLTCSIDGATDKNYRIYRVNGDLKAVIGNIKRINDFKKKYKSKLPVLIWKFTVFGHNENEIKQAKMMAHNLGMEFMLQFNCSSIYSQVRDSGLIKKQVSGGFSSRKEYFESKGEVHNQKLICSQLWNSPQINWDGRLLGCCINYWDDFGDIFKKSALEALNDMKINYARDMILGKKQPREDIPCSKCIYYKIMRNSGNWLKKYEIRLYDIRYKIKYAWISLFKGLLLPNKYWS